MWPDIVEYRSASSVVADEKRKKKERKKESVVKHKPVCLSGGLITRKGGN